MALAPDQAFVQVQGLLDSRLLQTRLGPPLSLSAPSSCVDARLQHHHSGTCPGRYAPDLSPGRQVYAFEIDFPDHSAHCFRLLVRVTTEARSVGPEGHSLLAAHYLKSHSREPSVGHGFEGGTFAHLD